MRASSTALGILMGGPSVEYDVSLESGRAILKALLGGDWRAVWPVLVSRNGTWIVSGSVVSPEKALERLDAVLLALHGEWGEDGQAQRILERCGTPYTGSRSIPSAVAMNKPISRAILREHYLPVPESCVYDASASSGKDRVAATSTLISRTWQPPFVVKPAGRGSSVGVSVVRSEASVAKAVTEALRYDTTLLVEEYLDGIEVSCGVLEELDGTLQALPVVQIVPSPQHPFFDYDAKYSGETQEIVPALLPMRVNERVQQAALAAHRALGCRHYSRTDMILLHGIPHILEVNTLPGMTPKSIFPKAATAAGIAFPDLLKRLVALALRDR